MNTISKEKIRPIYSELQGYLSQAPKDPKVHEALIQASAWEHYHSAIEELNKITGKDYNRFRVSPFKAISGPAVGIVEYRSRLGGLISRLHGEYFSDEPAPFSGMPSTIITQQQAQTQSMNVKILLDLQSKIDSQISQYEEGTNERTYLEKIKAGLSNIGDVTELVRLLLRTGKDYGLTIDKILTFFS
ncbi:MAG: hypothetical protein AABZ62_02240 [Planctomycetota bacterium]